MAENISDAFRKLFLAGVGAVAMTGEKSKELIEELVAQGEITVEQGKQFNQELQHKAKEGIDEIKEKTLYDRVASLKEEERDELIERLEQLKSDKNSEAKDA